MPDDVELLAAYFTISGDIYPLGPTEISPFPFRDRVEAAARAGYKGIGLHYADTIHTAAGIGLPEMRRILDGNGIKHVELEFLLDWFADGERRRDSDLMRAEILEAAAVLGLRAVKVGPGFHEPSSTSSAGPQGGLQMPLTVCPTHGPILVHSASSMSRVRHRPVRRSPRQTAWSETSHPSPREGHGSSGATTTDGAHGRMILVACGSRVPW